MARRTVCSLCLSLILGILYQSSGQIWYFLALILLQFVAGAGLVKQKERGKRIFLARGICCLCLFGAGAAHMQTQQAVRIRLEKELSPGQEIIVQGKVSAKEEKNKQFIYYLKDVRVVAEGTVFPSYGILIYHSKGQYQPGNIIYVQGRYQPFQISRNEGNFNEKQYQQSRKWEFRVFSESISLIAANENRYLLFLKKVRQRIREVFVSSMSAEDAGVMANLTLGDKSLLDREIKELYQRAGISHILAISGLHVSLFGMGIFRLLKLMGCTQKLGTFFAMGTMISFGMLSGMEVSAQRALGMFLLLMAAQAGGYSYDSLTALSLAAMVQLWENPFLLANPAFLFSYSAVLGVSLAARIYKDAARERKQAKKERRECLGIVTKMAATIKETMFVSLCIQLFTLPLNMYFYYEISPYSVLVNGCILPFLGLLLFLGITGGVLGSFLPFGGAALLKPAGWMLGINRGLCQAFLRLPAAEYITGKPAAGWLAVYYSLLLLSLYLVWRCKERRWSAVAVIAMFCLILIRQHPRFEISVLDVGQGDGSFIQTESGECFFVDGGSSDVKKVGEYRILPFLKSRGVSSIKGWVVSHADEDHISGLKEALQQGFSVEYLILAKGMVRDGAMEELQELAGEAGCQLLYVTPGMRFGTKDTVFTVLWPQSLPQVSENMEKDRNAASLSVLLEHREFTGIFTGDIGSEQEQELLEEDVTARHEISSVDFYKAAHHGANGSNSQKFLETISPKMTLISCGEKNSYGHPGTEALERIKKTQSRIFCTMDKGQIRVIPGKEGIQVWTFLP
ncbi:DNA internalization-related competence protein ComEC/Rec2 [Lachnospiraceae bacterium]|nr:DNA internalization-related competence protein ComEC/Rec2 [Lachnospiraceae bacterium]